MPSIVEFLLDQGFPETEAHAVAKRLGLDPGAPMEEGSEVEAVVQDTIQAWVNEWVGVTCSRCDQPLSRRAMNRSLKMRGILDEQVESWLCPNCHQEERGSDAVPPGASGPIPLPELRDLDDD